MIKRFLCIALSLMMISSMYICVSAKDTTQGGDFSVAVDFDDADDIDLFYGYMRKQTKGGGVYLRSVGNCESSLKDEWNKNVYRAFKTHAAKLAANGGATALVLQSEVFGDISVTNASGTDSGEALASALGSAINFSAIIAAAVTDCPYEFYWYDKTVGLRIGFGYTSKGNTSTITEVTVNFAVSEAYRAENYNDTAPAVDECVSSLSAVIATAKAVVDANKGKSDLEKLYAYRDYICDSVSYNLEVDQNTAYGDPWQIFYVFDGDSSTNVMCEGYTKAFQYLWELSDFSGKVGSYIVTGDMSGGTGAGKHMWNVIVTEKGHFLVDMTNSDEDSMGENGELFMNALPASGNAQGYIFNVDGDAVTYIYDSVTASMYSADILTLGLVDGTVTEVTITPERASVKKGEKLTFVAYISGAGSFDNKVTWDVSGGTSSETSVVDGVLTVGADETAEELTVTVRSVSDSTVFATASVSVLPADDGGSKVLYGDVSGDELINPFDASLILRYDAMLIGADNINLAAGDVSDDGTVNPFDASLILRYDAMLLSSFPADK